MKPKPNAAGFEDGFQRWVAWVVIAYNLKKIGATVAAGSA
jgi:hypothetical protein